MTLVSKLRSLNTAGAKTAGSSGLSATATPTALHCWRISSPYLAKVGKWTKSRVSRVPSATPGTPRATRVPSPSLFHPMASSSPSASRRSNLGRASPAACAEGISLEMGAVATLPSPKRIWARNGCRSVAWARARRSLGSLRIGRSRLKLTVMMQLEPPGLYPVWAGHAPQKVHLAVLEREHLRRRIGDDPHHQLVQIGQTGLEVARVAGETDLGALLVGDELERSGAHWIRVGGIRLRVRALVDMLGDDRSLGGVELGKQRRVGLLEPKNDRAVVRRLDSRERASHGRLGAGVELEEDLLEGELHVGRRERGAVVPLHSVAQAEPVDGSALLDLPDLRQLWDRVPALVAPEQAVVQKLGGRMGRTPGRDGGVQMARIGRDGHDEGAAPDGRLLGEDARRCEPSDAGEEERPEHGQMLAMHMTLPLMVRWAGPAPRNRSAAGKKNLGRRLTPSAADPASGSR